MDGNDSYMNIFMRILSTVFFLLLLISFPASAEVYKWVDEGGRVHFSDNRPKDKKVDSIDIKPIANTYTTPKISLLPELTKTSSTSAKRVVMYSASWCGVCKKARKYFQENSIAFTEYDIETDRKGKKDFDRLNGRGVPVILVGRKRLNGFNVSSFESIYKR